MDTAIAKDIAVQKIVTEVKVLGITSATVDMSNLTMSLNLKALSRHNFRHKGSMRKSSDSFKEKRAVDLQWITALASSVAQELFSAKCACFWLQLQGPRYGVGRGRDAPGAQGKAFGGHEFSEHGAMNGVAR